MSRLTPDFVEQIAEILTRQNLTLSTVESCTGGGISQRITEVAGSSRWFDRAFVTYSNLAKCQMVGVSRKTLEVCGAVSEATAREMAEGGLSNASTDFCLSVTGVAGPGGGSTEKPVGMVCFAWAGKDRSTQAETRYFGGDRTAVRNATINHALQYFLESFLSDRP